MKRFIPIFLFFMYVTLALAQESRIITVQGTVLGSKTKKPLPYANISLVNSRLGTVTNINGNFKILIPSNDQNQELRFSYIGFETTSLKLSKAKNIRQFYLTEDSKILNEVIFEGLTVESIIKKAIENIPLNYDQDPYTSKGFYRVTSQKDNSYIHLSEAVFELYQMNSSSKKNQFKLNKMRAIKDEKAAHGLQLGLKAGSIFEFDIVNNIDAIDLLNKKGLKNHEFKFEETTTYNGKRVYVISFDQKEGVKKSGYRGRLFIEEETYAFIHFDYNISPRGFNYLKYGDKPTRVLMDLLDIHIAFLENAYQLSYKKIGEKYYLTNAGNDARLSFKSSRQYYDFKSDVRVDYLVTNIENENVSPFSNEEVLGNAKLIENQDSPYDQTFWDGYNIILPNSDFGAISKVIETKNKANDLKKELEDKIYKYAKDKSIRIDSILSFYNRKGHFNGNALIEYEGETIFQKSYNNLQTENTKATQFRIGSTSKTFTSMLIMMLAKEKELNISDPIGMYLPKYKHGNITISELLTHQSGIPNYLNNNNYLVELFKKSYDLDDLVTQFCSDSLEFDPGSKFRYSNSGFVLLSQLIEKVTNKPFSQVLKERIFDKLEMGDSYFGNTKDSNNLATGYMYGKPEPKYYIQNVSGAGGITSTTEDLLKWSRAIDQYILLPKKNTEELFIPRAEYADWEGSYGYGWMIDNFMFSASKKHDIHYHPGTDFGFYSMFLKQPDKKISIILLNNTGDFPRFDITDLILDELN